MSNSDSEEDFESADEETEDVKHTKKGNSKSQQKTEVVTSGQHKEEKSDIPEKKEVEEESQASKWGSWGFSLISNASKQVASITTQVSNSISSAIESSINIPDPEEMAKLRVEEKKSTKEQNEDGEGSEGPGEESAFKLDSLVSNVTQISSKLVTGGLDTLEGIGKKTITILQESNPDIKSKLRNISGNKPNLSDILKEAKDRTDESPTSHKSENYQSVSFELLFEDNKGTVFYEALEILSNQSKMKIDLLMKPLDGRALQEIEETLDEVKELCELPDSESLDDDLTIEMVESKLEAATADLNIKLNFKELIGFLDKMKTWLDGSGDTGGFEIYSKSIDALANICALSLGNLHKLAELLLSKDHRSTADEADSLTQLTTIYCQLLNHIASLFSSKISALESNDENKKYVTNIFLESSTSISHIKNAFNLFIPILQIGAI